MWLHSSVGRAWHRYRGGHGFESRWSPDFFQASSFQLLKLENLLRWSHFTFFDCYVRLLCLRREFRATLNFQKFKVALNPLRRIVLNFAKSCILSCWIQFDNKKWGSPSLFLSYKRSKLKLRVFLAGHIVAMVTNCATKLTAICSPVIGQFVDTMTVALTDKEWL